MLTPTQGMYVLFAVYTDIPAYVNVIVILSDGHVSPVPFTLNPLPVRDTLPILLHVKTC